MKSYEDILEYYKILNELMNYCKLTSTKEKFIDLKIYKNKDNLEKDFLLLQDTIDFFKYDLGFDLEELKEISKHIESLNMFGSYFEAKDLFDIKQNLSIYRKSKNRVKAIKDKYKKLYQLFDNDFNTKSMEEFLNNIVDDNGNISDEASILLRDIRKQKNIINENIKDKLESMFTDPNFSKSIAEKIITKRNDRYVINVKSDFKGNIKGIEHDRSSTGNSVYIEPIGIVSLNNKFREYEAREREEIRKILLKVFEFLRNNKNDLENTYEVLKSIDFLSAKAQYAIDNDCSIPKIVNKPSLNLINAKHPLIDKNKVVPISFKLEDDQKIMLITGPNTGGKTVTLKVAGLLTIMALSAIAIPASEKSEIGMFENVLADIGDEQSIEQNLSSFSSHVKSISHIIDVCSNKSLVLLDELGSGTDPIEGSAFAMAIIDYLNQKNCFSIISTHYSEVKAHAYNNVGIKSASMEFDVKTLNPTYKLIEGLPGESNALIIAKKYGIADEILENAKSYISEDNKKVEQMLLAIKEKNEQLELLNSETEKLKNELETEKLEYKEKINQLEKEKNDIIEKSIAEADEYLKSMQAKAKALVDKINNEDATKENAKNIQRNINMLYNSIIEDKKKQKKKTIVEKTDIKYEIGEDVIIKSMNQNAKILKIISSKNSVQVQSGILKFIVPIDDIQKVIKSKVKPKGLTTYKTPNTKSEIDVRGKLATDAIHEIELFLDKAILSGYNIVYIVHGKGTMVLRQKIRDYLKTSPYVLKYEDSNPNEGGHGCTVVTLK